MGAGAGASAAGRADLQDRKRLKERLKEAAAVAVGAAGAPDGGGLRRGGGAAASALERVFGIRGGDLRAGKERSRCARKPCGRACGGVGRLRSLMLQPPPPHPLTITPMTARPPPAPLLSSPPQSSRSLSLPPTPPLQRVPAGPGRHAAVSRGPQPGRQAPLRVCVCERERERRKREGEGKGAKHRGVRVPRGARAAGARTARGVCVPEREGGGGIE